MQEATGAELLQLAQGRVFAAVGVFGEFMQVDRILRAVALDVFKPTQLAIREVGDALRRYVMECGSADFICLHHAVRYSRI